MRIRSYIRLACFLLTFETLLCWICPKGHATRNAMVLTLVPKVGVYGFVSQFQPVASDQRPPVDDASTPCSPTRRRPLSTSEVVRRCRLAGPFFSLLSSRDRMVTAGGPPSRLRPSAAPVPPPPPVHLNRPPPPPPPPPPPGRRAAPGRLPGEAAGCLCRRHGAGMFLFALLSWMKCVLAGPGGWRRRRARRRRAERRRAETPSGETGGETPSGDTVRRDTGRRDAWRGE